MILAGEILLILFFLFNMGKLIYDYLDDIREVKFMNMVFVLSSIGGLVFLNYLHSVLS